MVPFPIAGLSFQGSAWLWAAVLVWVTGTLLVLFTYRRTTLPRVSRRLAAGLKLAGFFLLGLCLLEPAWTGESLQPGSNLFLVLADDSRGLHIRDAGATEPRSQQLKRVLDEHLTGHWLDQIDRHYDLRRYTFGSRVERVEDFTTQRFEGHGSALVTALHTLAERFKDQPLAGILVLSDGNATDLPEEGLELQGLPPVYTALVGGPRPQRDLALRHVSVAATSFEDAPVTVKADLLAHGYRGEQVKVRLRDEQGRTVQEKIETIREDENRQAVRFRQQPVENGLAFYSVSVEHLRKDPAIPMAEASREATYENNHRMLTVDRGKGPYRILYVCGRPNWEYKFLNRALQEDPEVELVGLARIARKEPKFDFQGRAGETSNPLFRGFDRQGDETEQYDQPVMVRLNTRDSDELADGFPKVAKDLFRYHALILDDLEAGFFSGDQMDLIQQFVGQRGGGFMMLGGQESFRQGQYDNTPVGEMLPVYLDALDPVPPNSDLPFALSREGLLQPWMRLYASEDEEQDRLAAMPGFKVLNRVRSIKPGAQILGTVGEQTGQGPLLHPAVVVHRFGRGRAAALLLGDLWRWGMKDAERREEMEKAWRQTMRWLIADVPGRLTLEARSARDEANQPVTLTVHARNPEFEPVDNARVQVAVTAPGGEVLQLEAEAVSGKRGEYQTVYVPRAGGFFRAAATVTDMQGNELGQPATGWSVNAAGEEFRSLKANAGLMRDIARQTGGETVKLKHLERFARELKDRDAPVMQTWSKTLWHTPWIFFLALGCFIGEWALRRIKGLA